jgi:hypothetical protein
MRSGLLDRSGSPAPGGSAAPAPAGPAGGGSGSGGRDRPIAAPAGRQWATGDPITRLPQAAAEKLARLHRVNDEAAILMRSYDEQRAWAGEAKERAALWLDRVRHSRLAGSRVGPTTFISPGRMDPGPFGIEHVQPHDGPADNHQLALAERELAAATAKLNDINRLIDEVAARRSRLPETLTAWVAALPAGIKIEPHREPAGRKSPAKLEALRAEISRLKAQIEQTRAAPLPSGDAKRKMRDQIEALAAKGEPNCLGLIEAGYPVRFVENQVQATVLTPAGAGALSHSALDTLALFCWVHGDALIARLEAQIDELSEDSAALSDQDKQKKIQQLNDEILEVSRSEETAIEALELSGSPVARRPDCDPRAVLSLSSDLPGPGIVPMF